MSIRKLFAVAGACLMLAASFCGCALTEPQQTVPIPDYTEVTTLVKNYEDAYREYVQTGDGQVTLVTANGVTPLGCECFSKYTRTADGLYESCSLTVQREVEQHDEYFNLSDDAMLFVRGYVDLAGMIVIQKYYCTSTAVYYINYENETLDPVEHVSDLDCFVTFDQVRRVYGADESASE